MRRGRAAGAGAIATLGSLYVASGLTATAIGIAAVCTCAAMAAAPLRRTAPLVRPAEAPR
ncbi:hypothetical protein OM076_28085 [Solirubrobacter ginsenosidimutans]|uniref:Uncharacterized protein n=1 Tax=Solirubrobacter ginsenosidimutans TaxID=490573 RepID=A0A9X3MWG3_9ACTN|nr:hypothetical protein [Solirubrobacter ginsenosidimutans]MDA0164166.1 hypothetical protein [Solirubrobacter ginsenosidimutans]